jgi:hypothetical protein
MKLNPLLFYSGAFEAINENPDPTLVYFSSSISIKLTISYFLGSSFF